MTYQTRTLTFMIAVVLTLCHNGHALASPTSKPEDADQARLPLPDAIINRPYAAALPLAFAVGKVESFTDAGTLPEGLVLEGLWIKGQPKRTGEYVFRIRVRDEIGQQLASQCSLRVLPPPPAPLRIGTNQLQPCFACSSYSQALEAQGGSPPYNWEIIEGRLPEGLALRGNRIEGMIRNQATVVSKLELTVRVIDSVGAVTTGKVEIPVHPNSLVMLRPAVPFTQPTSTSVQVELPPIVYGEPVLVRLPFVGGLEPLVVRLVDGRLPNGITLEDHWLRGKSVNPGTHDLKILVTDAAAQSLELRCTLRVLLPCTGPLQIGTASLPLATLGEQYRATLKVIGGVPPYSWELAGVELPRWAKLENDTISGDPGHISDVGTHDVEVRVTDSMGVKAGPIGLQIRVEPKQGSQPLSIVPSRLPPAWLSEDYEVMVPVRGGLPPYTFRLTAGSLPDNVAFSVDGLLKGRPQTPGRWELKVQVEDKLGQQVETAMSVLVRKSGESALRVDDFSPLRAQVGQEFQFRIPAFGGTLPYRYELNDMLPPGIEFDSRSGLLKGMPTRAGNWERLTLNIADASPDSQIKTLQFSIGVARSEHIWAVVLLITGMFIGLLLRHFSLRLWALLPRFIHRRSS